MPLYKGNLYGETMADGLPKGLPKGLPMLQPRSGLPTFTTDALLESPNGETIGETFGETFQQGPPIVKGFATGRFSYIMGRR